MSLKLTFWVEELESKLDYMDEVGIFANYEHIIDDHMGGEVVVFTFQNEFDFLSVENFHLTGEK